MRRSRRVYDQLKRQFVTGWLGRKEARTVRNIVAMLNPELQLTTPQGVVREWHASYGPRFICTGAKRKRKK
jgi:hypothetical protein